MPAQPPFRTPTRTPTIGRSARAMMSLTRFAAASVKVSTLKLGKAMGLSWRPGSRPGQNEGFIRNVVMPRAHVEVPGGGPAAHREHALRPLPPLPSRPGDRHHVVEALVGGVEEAANAARGLADALLVLDEGDAHVIVAVLAETDARRHRDVGLLDEEFRELEAAERPEFLRDRHPGEHRRARARNRPAGLGKGIDEHVAAPLVDGAHLAD